MKMFRLISLLSLLLIMLAALFPPGAALAQDETSPESITLTTEFPKLDAIATGSFDFTVELQYAGQIDRVFDLDVTVPTGWDATVTPQYDTKLISSITMEKSSSVPTTKSVQISATPPAWPLAEPGEYTVTLKASSGNISGEIDLIAKITARYALDASPSNEVYNTKASAGNDNTFSVTVMNSGTAPIDNITFSSDKPSGWEITFKPEKIELLEIFDPKTIDVNIKPPPKTVAGDYVITLMISGKQASATSMDIRVTVTTPTIWGWVGVGIIAIVVVGLIVIFMRFGRR
jgi:uncharacterized repeat protein (TIGR01451 family)